MTYLPISFVVQGAFEKIYALVIQVNISEWLKVHKNVDLSSKCHHSSFFNTDNKLLYQIINFVLVSG